MLFTLEEKFKDKCKPDQLSESFSNQIKEKPIKLNFHTLVVIPRITGTCKSDHWLLLSSIKDVLCHLFSIK